MKMVVKSSFKERLVMALLLMISALVFYYDFPIILDYPPKYFNEIRVFVFGVIGFIIVGIWTYFRNLD